jgi:hypothetical protein
MFMQTLLERFDKMLRLWQEWQLQETLSAEFSWLLRLSYAEADKQSG